MTLEYGNVEKLCTLCRVDDPEELEDLSCTDLTQQRGKLKKASLSEFEAVAVKEFCHFSPPLPIQRVSQQSAKPKLQILHNVL